MHTPWKLDMDTEHDGLEEVVTFKHGYFWGIYMNLRGVTFSLSRILSHLSQKNTPDLFT